VQRKPPTPERAFRVGTTRSNFGKNLSDHTLQWISVSAYIHSRTAPSNAMSLTNTSGLVTAWLRRWAHRLTEPQILFPVFAVLLLGMIWATTLGLIKFEGASAERAAAASSRELVETPMKPKSCARCEKSIRP
jgi:hypothetical protein